MHNRYIYVRLRLWEKLSRSWYSVKLSAISAMEGRKGALWTRKSTLHRLRQYIYNYMQNALNNLASYTGANVYKHIDYALKF